ncbi:MAG: hypothetical protein K0U86_13255 [Planctomycetes bacterium]|nr:hypothetical protein [Planctomycetota bacterium]MCH9725858.1 hypothetical protein [Planctomycetota bacterium]MCH9775422.1 hypothetical protein [Planctomycetota bacterium]MCH9793087.1 hypothetical protein [Planctomycetota bacterium]
MTRIFLAIVGILYLVLALWCAIAPETTSQSVGFTIKPGSGQSEFLTVYGGLELGLALVFFWPLLQNAVTRFSLGVCLMVHGSLVLFRSIGFFLFTDFESTTFYLAGGEWLIFLISLTLWYRQNRSTD